MEMHPPLFNSVYLRSVWANDYEKFKNSLEAQNLLARLKNWATKDWQKETASESAFIDVFFKQTWGYFASGEKDKEEGFTLQQQYPVKDAGQKGGTGEADTALGYFGQKNMEEIPQVLGEFKDDRSGLDKPQLNRPNNRSPVDQCLDYLRESRTGLISSILPTWGLVTDMNEFRLYYYGNKAQYQRFIIKPSKNEIDISLLGENEEAEFHRFLFHRMFNSESLLTLGGKSKLEKLLDEQIIQEQALENLFYTEYHAFRKTIYWSLCQLNPQYEQEGRLRRLVKYTQRILDRCLFILYCEDMGRELNFPPNVLRNVLIRVSTDEFYSPDDEDAWIKVKRLFASMRDGTPFGPERINRFNGGLFDEDPEMDALKLPNRVFCEQNQAQSIKRLLQYPKTLLYFSAKYNFGTSEVGKERTLTLTALGRIFEQSITDLEVMEAHAENRESLAELTKRKRDGVYYTPEWVTHYIVEETVGLRLNEIRQELGFDKFTDVTDEQIKEYIKDRRRSKIVGKYKKALHQYSERLNKLKVVDPACGSGAFLIQAFKYLYEQRQWVAKELERVTGGEMGLFDMHSNMRAVLSENLYGVDINAESVEITRLALWLYTALPDRPLTSLDQNIRCGNSLIGHDFYEQMGINCELLGEDEQERVNTFDWAEAFPEIFKGNNPGFDCVIGNPPYVKLQHFRKIQKDVAKYLMKASRKDGNLLYESTQSGNFDIYLPFIERGVDLLNKQGKMGYIAPNVWLVNEYGKGLRQKLKRTQRLDRWIDFKSYQVFNEAITYTALQFFTGSPQDSIRCVFAPDGKQNITALDWRITKDAIVYNELPKTDSWLLIPVKEKRLITLLSSKSDQLGSVVESISQGLISGAFWIFTNEKLSEGNYLHNPKQKVRNVPSHNIEIEKEITLKLATGDHIKRYQSVQTNLGIIFPYTKDGKAKLYEPHVMERDFPNTWKFLKIYETFLRKRDDGKLDEKYWYRYSRNQNLDKQSRPKLMIAGTAQNVLCSVDENGEIAANDKRVYSIFTDSVDDLWFFAGILNSPVISFIFKRIARPKAGGFFDIETQFLSPLPIPRVTDEEKAEVVKKAKNLQNLHTQRRNLLLMIDKRLGSTQCEDETRDEKWLWADVKSVATLKKEAPPELKGRELTAWAKSLRELKLAAHLEKIDLMLHPGVVLSVKSDYGELKLMTMSLSLIEGVFLSEDEALFIAAQWRQKIRQTNITEKFTAKKLINLLLKLRNTDNPAINEQVVRLDADIRTLEEQITQAEADMNRLTYFLYKLTDEEIRLVKR